MKLLIKMNCEEIDKNCGKCDAVLKLEDKAVTCFTCKQDFHTHCEHVSDDKHAILSDQNDGAGLVWFCRTCMRTTAGMLRHVANLEIRLNKIEAEREKDRHEVSVLQNLVKALNKKVNSLEENVQQCTESNQGEIDTIKQAVTTMLNEVPQTTSLEDRFSSIENSLSQLNSITSIDRTLCLDDCSDTCVKEWSLC